MTPFQILGIGLAAVMTVHLILGMARSRRHLRTRLAWLTVWTSAAIMIWKPDLTMKAAKAVGIGRGTDLVFYLAILGFTLGFFVVYLRILSLESHITELVRRLALSEARDEDADTSNVEADPAPR